MRSLRALAVARRIPRAQVFLCALALFGLSACKSTVTKPPTQWDGTVVITFVQSATGASMNFSDAGAGTVALGVLPDEPVLIDPFTYPYYETILFLHMDDAEQDIRVQRVTEENGDHSLHVERRTGANCPPWELIASIPVNGSPGAKIEGFGEPESNPRVFACR